MPKKIYEDTGRGDASVREAGYSRVRPCLGDTASPRKTIAVWLSLITSSSSSLPIFSPTLDLGTVVILSTISRDGERSPLRSFGSTASRNNGTSA
jgi:hypothetical protein